MPDLINLAVTPGGGIADQTVTCLATIASVSEDNELIASGITVEDPDRLLVAIVYNGNHTCDSVVVAGGLLQLTKKNSAITGTNGTKVELWELMWPTNPDSFHSFTGDEVTAAFTGSGEVASAMAVIKVAGGLASDGHKTNVGNGNSTYVNMESGLPAYAEVLQLGVIGFEGPSTDTEGTYGEYIALARDGTSSLGAGDRTLAVCYKQRSTTAPIYQDLMASWATTRHYAALVSVIPAPQPYFDITGDIVDSMNHSTVLHAMSGATKITFPAAWDAMTPDQRVALQELITHHLVRTNPVYWW